MAITPKSAFGTQLKIGDGGGTEVFNLLEGCRNFSGPESTFETIDVTNHSSPGNYREVVPSFLDGGEISFDIIWDSTNTYHAQLWTDHQARTLRNFQMILKDAGDEQLAFAAYITSVGNAASIDDAVVRPVTLKLDGAITSS